MEANEKEYLIKIAEAKARELYENCTLTENKYVTDLKTMLDEIGFKSFITDFDELFQNNDSLKDFVKENKLEGFTLLNPNEMYIDNKILPLKQRFIIAHEIGHIVLEHYKGQSGIAFTKDSSLQNNNDINELIANYFAAELLIPTSLFNYIYSLTKCHSDLAAIFGVQINVMRFKLRRLKEVGII